MKQYQITGFKYLLLDLIYFPIQAEKARNQTQLEEAGDKQLLMKRVNLGDF